MAARSRESTEGRRRAATSDQFQSITQLPVLESTNEHVRRPSILHDVTASRTRVYKKFKKVLFKLRSLFFYAKIGVSTVIHFSPTSSPQMFANARLATSLVSTAFHKSYPINYQFLTLNVTSRRFFRNSAPIHRNRKTAGQSRIKMKVRSPLLAFFTLNLFPRSPLKDAAMENSTRFIATSTNWKRRTTTKLICYLFVETFRPYEITRISNAWLFRKSIKSWNNSTSRHDRYFLILYDAYTLDKDITLGKRWLRF